MTSLQQEDRVMSSPKAVQTNGEGKRTNAHLNLTRSLAEVWREQAEAAKPRDVMKLSKTGGPSWRD